ncbi:Endocuticle structural glycoprotein SgAbd-2, partial [Ooceraea biroi]
HQTDNRRPTSTTPIPILHWNKQQEHDGTYKTSYETGNNIIAEESGYIKTIGEGEERAEAIVQQGTFSYTSPEGQLITIHYTADETGFHAQGDHIPTPPPVSEEIQKGLDLIYAGIRQQEVRISMTFLPSRSDPSLGILLPCLPRHTRFRTSSDIHE